MHAVFGYGFVQLFELFRIGSVCVVNLNDSGRRLVAHVNDCDIDDVLPNFEFRHCHFRRRQHMCRTFWRWLTACFTRLVKLAMMQVLGDPQFAEEMFTRFPTAAAFVGKCTLGIGSMCKIMCVDIALVSDQLLPACYIETLKGPVLFGHILYGYRLAGFGDFGISVLNGRHFFVVGTHDAFVRHTANRI